MKNLIPENTRKYLESLPKNMSDVGVMEKINKFRRLYGESYVKSIIWTQEDAKKVLRELGADEESSFSHFYMHSFDFPGAYRNENIYGLSEILNDYRKPFWGEKYPKIQEKNLLLSSVEGEYSYFYGKGNDAVYGVDWGDMDQFILGDLEPLFVTFHEFLQWYYSDDDE